MDSGILRPSGLFGEVWGRLVVAVLCYYMLVSLYFQVQLPGLPSWFTRYVRLQFLFLFCGRSLPAESNPFCGSAHTHCLLVLRSHVAHVSPRWLSNPQDAAKFRRLEGSHICRGLCKCLLSAWGLNHLRARYFIHGLFCTGLLTANF